MNSLDIRKKFFDFFVKNNHHKGDSSSLIPAQDPTLLFTNAGMNQYKDLFLGNEKRSYTRATTIQKCVRAGGKHNDLENVGFTKRHLTFFEMMGNFSFGDYFKKEAIAFAWNLLTQEYKIDPKNMYVSVFENDDEAFDIWNKTIGISAERIMRFGAKDNFWQMGDTGPCGPCTEIYIDLRSESEKINHPVYQDFEDGKLLEIWNLVFMQFDRQSDGTLVPLKQTGVDTGMGLERVTCVLQKKDNVYQTDIFMPLIHEIEKLTGLVYEKQDAKTKAAFHVLCDHVRSTSLIIADGGSPSNEGRGYVLRKIIRRAALFAQKLSGKNIFPDLATFFIENMGPIYPELITSKAMIVSILRNEIDQFANNLIKGQAILDTYCKLQTTTKMITGQQAFKLYDTYGFPLEVTNVACQELGYTVDVDGFEVAMEEQRAQSGKKMKDARKDIELPESVTTEFVGYKETEVVSEIVGFIVNDAFEKEVLAGQACMVIAKVTPFFAATGGQVDDTGSVIINGMKTDLLGLQKLQNNKAIGCSIIAPIACKIGDVIIQKVDNAIRTTTAYNHTATHMLQAALIELLGKQVKQSGSVVHPDYLRFDFTYHQNLSPEQIVWIENRVNDKIRENIEVEVFETTQKKAIERGVIAIFGEKYNPECVRVVDIPGFSAELCGGTHVPRTGNIGTFKIIEVSALSAGNRRILAFTGPQAVHEMQNNFSTVKTVCQHFKIQSEEVLSSVEKQATALKNAQQHVTNLKKRLIAAYVPQWLSDVEMIKNIPCMYLQIDDHTIDDVKEASEQLQSKKPGIYFVCANNGDTAVFYATIAPQYAQSLPYDTFVALLKDKANLKGGGKKGVSAQGGGPRIASDFKNQLLDFLKANI